MVSSTEILPGNLYGIPNDQGGCGLVKVLAVDPEGIHLRFYMNVFDELPEQVDPETLEWFLGHTPLSNAAWRDLHNQAVLIDNLPVTDDELEGYQYWRLEHGGYFA
jgi:hypothetical protein